MSGLKWFALVLTFVAFTSVGNVALAQDESNQSNASPNSRLNALPADIQKRIKSRKRAIVKTRREIRSLSPEGKAELQATIEEWFKTLPLEKQVEIKIRMGGGVPSIDQFKNIENPVEKDAKEQKEELKPTMEKPGKTNEAPAIEPKKEEGLDSSTPKVEELKTKEAPATAPAPEEAAEEKKEETNKEEPSEKTEEPKKEEPASAEPKKEEKAESLDKKAEAGDNVKKSVQPESTPASMPETKKATLTPDAPKEETSEKPKP